MVNHFLKILKYSGLVIAAIASIWTLKTISDVIINNQKELTWQGYISIGFIILGVIINIVSQYLEDKDKRNSELENNINETKKINTIISAGQPLINLNISIHCKKNEKFINYINSSNEKWQIEHQQASGVMSNSRGEGIQREFRLPLFTAAVKGVLKEWGDHFLLLISWGEDESCILSYGYLSDDVKLFHWNDKGEKISNNKKTLSEGILFEDDVQRGSYQGIDLKIFEPTFDNDNDSIVLNWNVNAYTLKECLHKLDNQTVITANLPDTIKITILFDIKDLPFSTTNFTSGNRFIWYESNIDYYDDQKYDEEINSHEPINHIFKNSILEISPNRSNEFTKYNLDNIYEKYIIEEDIQESVSCRSLLLVYKKQ